MNKFARHVTAIAALSFAASAFPAPQLLPDQNATPNYMKVTALFSRNQNSTIGAQGFYFQTDTAFNLLCGSTAMTGVFTFAVTRADPTFTGTGTAPDNPAYRDNVDLLIMAWTAGSKVSLYVDGCTSDNVPKVTGINVYP